jgi:hypothetical protein
VAVAPHAAESYAPVATGFIDSDVLSD